MGFFHENDEFYLLIENTPRYPFPQLPDIVSRAKQLLKDRTRKEIISAANIVEWFIEEYFKRCKDELIQNILTERDSLNNWVLGYLPYDSQGAHPSRGGRIRTRAPTYHLFRQARSVAH